MALPKAALLLGTAATLACFAAPAAAQSSASPHTKAVRYDMMRRPTGTIAPDPDGGGPLAFAAVRNSYDAAGRLIKVEKGELSAWQSEGIAPASWSGFTVHQTVDYSYDAAGRKVKETLSGGGMVHSVTQTSYDADNQPECTVRRMNSAAFGSVPASACTPGSEGSFGPDRIVRRVHDAAGQLLQVREAVGTGLEAAEATYSYTANGKNQFVIDGRGNKAEFRYDGHDRLARWVFPSLSAPGAFNDATQATALSSAGALNEGDYEEYGYDAAGNRSSLRTRAGEMLGFSYDALNRVTAKDRPGSEPDVAYAYDLRGLQTSASFPATGEALTNAYDKAGRPTSATSTMHGMSRTFSYLYDANGNRTRMTWNDGFWVGYETDGLNRVTAIREYGSTLLVSYGYDAQGRRSGVTRGNGTAISYGYDAAGRPSQIADDLAGTSHDQVLGFSYNPAGQIVQNTRSNDAYAWTGHYNVNRSYTANGLNQYTLSGSVAPSYDARGNLTQAGGPVYGYTSENMLVSASGGITLAYDPAGRLAQTSGGSAGTTRLGYDGTDLAAEYDGAGNLLRRYVHGPGTDDPLVWYEGAGTSDRRWLHPDERGSIVGVSNSSGAVTTISRYDEYGIPASTNAGRFQYTGQTWLPELGMYYYKARIYSPTLGRFLQRDPIGYEDGMNMYNYVGSDPITHSDPTGTYGCMKKEECQEIEAARRQIVNARNALAHQAGSRVSTAANDLTKIINTLGTKNDGNGLQVNFGSLKGGALGVFDPNSTTITIDKSNIANIPGGSVASTLTHEVSHARDHKLGIPYMRFLSEIKANAFAAMYEKGSGRPGVYWQPGISKEQLIRNIKESGMAYCSGAGIRSVRDYCTRVINQIHPDVPIR